MTTWRLVQKGRGAIAIAYLIHPNRDADLRDAMPGIAIVATGEAPPQGDFAGALKAASAQPADELILIGYSAGCSSVRAHLLAGVTPAAVVTIDGTHASWPAAPYQIKVWRELAEKARRGELLWVATCTQQIYTEALRKPEHDPFMATVHVLEEALGQKLPPGSSVHDGLLHVVSYASKSMDGPAHIAQQVEVLPAMLREHVGPYLATLGLDDSDPTAEVPGWRNAALPLAERCVLWCVAELEAGVREVPPGSNTGPRIKQYLEPCSRRENGKPLGLTAAAWCAAAQSCCQRECLLPGEHGSAHGYYCSGVELRDSAKAAGTWREPGYQPRRGDVVILMRAGSGSDKASQTWERHVVRVELAGDVTIGTIGGNEANAWGRQTIRLDDARIEGFIDCQKQGPSGEYPAGAV